MNGLHLGAADGLRGLPQIMAASTVARAPDGRLWFATNVGIAVINPRRLPRNDIPPPVVIEGLKADDGIVSPSTGLHLRPNTRILDFEYTGLSFADPERVRFRYKLEDFDRDWRGPVSVRTVRYTNLPPRNYRFRVIACNNDGVWNEEGAALGFDVLPAFYQTNWFILVCALADTATLCALYWLRIRRTTAEINVRFDERLDERTRIARQFHDTLLQTIQGSSLVAQDALNQPADTIRMRKALERLQGWLSQAVEEGRSALNSLRTSAAEKNDLAEGLRRAGEECSLHSSRATFCFPKRSLHRSASPWISFPTLSVTAPTSR